MADTLRIAIAQLNPTVGDLDGNVAKALAMVEQAEAADEIIAKYDADASGTIDLYELARIVGDLEQLKAQHNNEANLQRRGSTMRMPAPQQPTAAAAPPPRARASRPPSAE